ncbi:protein NDNF isoform X1 [Anguilla rostrata]|uniref:protein NDNF isoform X1 n=1 Tax=Anguilla rostrata TaxID=7938 RepID=UPI0030CE9699
MKIQSAVITREPCAYLTRGAFRKKKQKKTTVTQNRAGFSSTRVTGMALSWCHCLAAALLCGPVWALAPENEVPLRATSWLPDSQVTSIHLPKDRTRRLYFTLKKKTPMMSVTVSPCDVPIEWTLSARTLKDKPLKNLHWSSKKSMPEVWWRGPGMEVKMHSYTGNAVETFRGAAYAPASIYILRLRSREQDTRASVYLQEGAGPPGAFPELPPDPRVHTVGVGMTSVTLSWSPSNSVLRLPPGGSGYRYCVLVNRKHNYRSLCAAEEAAKDRKKRGKKVTAWPILKEWWWQQWDSFEEGEEGAPLPDPPAGLRCACEGAESVCTVSELTPDTQYYFDVFAMDTRNGTSSAYTGTFARTHEEARPAVAQLREGERRWVPLRGEGRQGGPLFSFHPQGWQQSALLTLQSCGAEGVRLTVSSKGQVLASRPVGSEVAQVWLQGKPSYLIHLEGGTPAPSGSAPPGPAVKLQVSSAYHRQAPPSLPPTLQIKSFNRLRGCRSVTLAWLGTEERSLYCVYRRQLGEGEGAAADRCLGPESRGDAEKVLCKYFQELNPRRAVTTATIAGLEPGAAYVFDVYLMRRWGIPIKYHSKTVRTRKDC